MINEIIVKNGITNFSVEEVLHGNLERDIPLILIPNIAPTLKLMQLIRDDIGIPIEFNSTFRSAKHNLEVNGKSGSLHLSFNAIDFAPVNLTTNILHTIYADFLRGKYQFDFEFNGKLFHVKPTLCGIGLYDKFIHVDTRGLLGRLSPAVWRG